MNMTAARWANREKTEIIVGIEGIGTLIKAQPGLAIYDDIVALGIDVAAYRPTPADVRAEAQRRIIALTGAADFNGCIVKQLNASMRATELTNKRAMGSGWTPEEAAEAAALQALATAIKAIRSRSNAMEPSPPDDYADDARWQDG